MVSNIRVLHVCNEIGLGGTERGIISMCKTMRYDLFEHEVFCAVRGGARAGEIGRAASLHIPSESAKRPVDPLPALAELCRTRMFDVAVIHRAGCAERTWSEMLRILRAAKIPLVIEINIFGLVDSSPEDELIDWHLHISKTSYCSFRKRALDARYPRIERHRVLYIPIETSTYAPGPNMANHRINLRKRLGFTENDLVLLRVGRPDFRKWGDLLLESIPVVLRKIPQACFVFLSAPPSRAWYMRHRFPADRVRVLPATSDDGKLRDAYESADVYLHSSRRGESYGASLVEAMAASLPIVVNSTPWRDNAQVELVEHMRTGIIANSPKAISEALAHLHASSEDRLRMGQAGRAKAEALYDASVVCKSLASLIVTTLDQGRSLSLPEDFESDGIWPAMQEIEAYWHAERAKREADNWDGLPPRRFPRSLTRVAWDIVDVCEWAGNRAGIFR
jgi:glycosyltransferase involved in cell wall biosynthesis